MSDFAIQSLCVHYGWCRSCNTDLFLRSCGFCDGICERNIGVGFLGDRDSCAFAFVFVFVYVFAFVFVFVTISVSAILVLGFVTDKDSWCCNMSARSDKIR